MRMNAKNIVSTLCAAAILALGARAQTPAELDSPDEQVRARAAASLGRRARTDKALLKPLADLMKDSSPRVRREAADALSRTGPEALPLVEAELLRSILAAPTESAFESGRQTRVSLNRGPGSGPRRRDPAYSAYWEAQKAAEGLGRLGAVARLTKLAGHRSRMVAAAAARGLAVAAETEPEGPVEGLRIALRRGGPALDPALSGLHTAGPAAATAALEVAALLRRKNELPLAPLRTLAAMGPGAAAAVPAVAALLMQDRFGHDAAATLAKLGPDGERELLKAMDSPSGAVRDAAYHAVRDLESPEAKAAARAVDGSYPVRIPSGDGR